jgi:hypothetical protein
VKNIIFFGLFWLLPSAGIAAAYWMEVKGSGKSNEPVTIRVIYGLIDEYSIRHRDTGKELNLVGEFKVHILDENGQRITIGLSRKADCWEGEFTPTHNGVYRILGINDSHPVIDRSRAGERMLNPLIIYVRNTR